MKDTDTRPEQAAKLRRTAEEIAGKEAALTEESPELLSFEETRRMLHELRVQHFGLEMQNEELRRAQVELETARARYCDLYDLAPVGYCTISERGAVLEANPAVFALLGRPKSTTRNQLFAGFVLKEDRDIYYLNRKKLLRTLDPQECELRMVKKDGAPFWAHLTMAAAQDDSGAPACHVVLLDITERRRAQEVLRESEDRYHLLFESESDALFLVDTGTGLIIDTNRVALEQYGYDRDELLTKKSWDLSAEPAETQRRIRETRTCPGQAISIPVRFHRKKDGTVFPVEITARPLTLKGGLCLLVAARDITERRQMEEVHSFLAQTTGTANEPFFNVLARYLAHTLGMDYVCIDRLERDGLTAHTVAVWCDGHFEDNVRYALHDTPCGDVVGKQVCCFPASVRQCFPRSEVLVGLCAESYVGVTLWDHTGQPIDLITVIGRRPLANRPLVEAVLKLVALRAAGELERLEAEEGLRESEERLSDITYSMADWVWETDANGIYTYSSQKSLDVLGLSQEEIIGKTPFDFMPADEAARVRAICSEVFARKAPIRDLENWHIAKNGERICLLTNGVPILDLEDNLKGYRGVDRNITSRKRAEEELRKSEEKYRFLVENSYDIIYTITAAGLFTFVAPAWTTILGHPTTQVVGRSFESFVHPDDIEECRAFLRRVIETGQRQEGIEYRVQHINGTWRWHTSSAVFIKNAADPFAAFQGIAKDITDRKQAEEARTAPC